MKVPHHYNILAQMELAKKTICCFLLVLIATGAAHAKVPAKVKTSSRTDYRVTVDSIEQLRERYCDMLAYDLQRAPATLEKIKIKFNSLPAAIQESLLKDHYDVIVNLYEQERLQRASAFADCYYALAKPEDPNLGALYLNDIVLAIEALDEAKLRKRIDGLRNYADLNNLNYDQDLQEAETNYSIVRQQNNFKKHSLSDFVSSGFWMLDTEDLAMHYGESAVEWILYIPMIVELDGIRVRRYSMHEKPRQDKDKNYRVDCLSVESNDYGYDVDLASKTMYSIWGRERTRSANPILLSGFRQTVQNTHAMVAGELSRKKYSYGKRIAGNAVATLVDAGLNALFDWLSVTTEYYYRCELSLTMTNPGTLEGELAIATTTVKSNNLDNPDTKKGVVKLKYYRTEPKFGMFPIYKKKPLYSGKMESEKYIQLSKHIEEKLKMLEPDIKNQIKQLNEQNSNLKLTLEDFYNLGVLGNIRQKAGESLGTHPLTK